MQKIHRLFFFICLIFNAFYSYCQKYPIPGENALWGIVTCYGPPGLPGAGCYGSAESFTITDTVINGKTYKSWGDNIFTRYFGNRLLMIDNEKSVPESIKEVIYYDFNLNVNDSILLPFWYDSTYAVVYEKDEFICLNGQIRKRLKLMINGYISCSDRLEWIEGIGDILSTVFYHNRLGLCDIYPHITCFSDSSGYVFKDPYFDFSCDSIEHFVNLYINEDEIIKNVPQNLIITPNPFSDEILIDFPNPEMIKSAELYNMLGKFIKNSDDLVFKTEEIEKGIYIIRIDIYGQYYLFKMVKY